MIPPRLRSTASSSSPSIDLTGNRQSARIVPTGSLGFIRLPPSCVASACCRDYSFREGSTRESALAARDPQLREFDNQTRQRPDLAEPSPALASPHGPER